MKKLFLLLAGVLAATAVQGQTPAATDPWVQTELTKSRVGRSSEPVIIQKSPKPNEIKGKRTIWSGIAVQVFKTDHPLQLINPAAPARYGAAEDNVARDPITGKSSGLKVFSFTF